MHIHYFIILLSGAVGSTCNPATLVTESWNGWDSESVGGNSPSIRWVVCVTNCNPAQGEKAD